MHITYIIDLQYYVCMYVFIIHAYLFFLFMLQVLCVYNLASSFMFYGIPEGTD